MNQDLTWTLLSCAFFMGLVAVVAYRQSRGEVASGEGYLVVTMAQFPGARPMSIEALLNGRSQQMSAGNRLSIHASPDSSAQ